MYLDYLAELHKAHNSYLRAPEKTKIEKEWMPDYQKTIADELGLKLNDTKLVLMLRDKENYVVHYRNLQFYLNQGLKRRKVHRVLECDQSVGWSRMNTEFWKRAKNEFKNFYKHRNNSPFGKTMENVWKRVNIKIVRSDDRKKVRKLITSHRFAGYTLFSNDPAGFRMHTECAKLNKPICCGMTILDNSKIMMYDFYYNDLKRQYGPKRGLIYTDTDSLMQEIETNDVYKDMGSKRNCMTHAITPKTTPYTAAQTIMFWAR